MDFILKPVRSAFELVGRLIPNNNATEIIPETASDELGQEATHKTSALPTLKTLNSDCEEEFDDDASCYDDEMSTCEEVEKMEVDFSDDEVSVVADKKEANNGKSKVSKTKGKRGPPGVKKIRHVDCIIGIGKSSRSKFEDVGITSMRMLKRKRKTMSKLQLKRLMMTEVGLSKRTTGIISKYLAEH